MPSGDRNARGSADARPRRHCALSDAPLHSALRAHLPPPLRAHRVEQHLQRSWLRLLLHRARLSPVTLTRRLTEEERRRLQSATVTVLDEWTQRQRQEAGGKFPEKVTAFREGMAVHGRFGLPCPDCGTPVQRIVHASNETNYCARCQTGGKLLADRALSQLLRKDSPKTVDELDR